MLYSMSSEEKNTKTRILEATWHLMEQRLSKEVSMSDIAKTTGISRQGIYLHFPSRTELLIATAIYVDEVKDLPKRVEKFNATTNGIELLDTCVDVWGSYIPEIYGLAKALLRTRDTDEAAAAAWNDRMNGLRSFCTEVIEALDRDGTLSPEWPPQQAIEMLWTIISINNWEQLTKECGWSKKEYIERMKKLLKRTFVAQ